LTDISGLQSQLQSLCTGTPPDILCGVTRFDSQNTKWDFGLTGGYAIRRNLVAIGEFSRTRALNPNPTFSTYYQQVVEIPCDPYYDYDYYYYYYPCETYNALVPAPGISPVVRKFSTHVTQFTGGVQYQVPVNVWRLAPFVGFGVGVARAAMNSKDPGVSDLSRSHSTLNFASGARVYLSPTWGVRPELKVVRFLSGTNETAVRASIGVFYQFRP
jgi:hypothetical protein